MILCKGNYLFKGASEMKHQQTGIGGLQLLVVLATIAAISFVASTKEQVALDAGRGADMVKVAQALEFAGESQRKIAQSFASSHSLPRTLSAAHAMKPTMVAKPEFVREVKFQPDYAGRNIMIMVYLDDGVVDNILGGEQYIYIAGVRSGEGHDALEWQCGARNVDLTLLPEHCRI